MDKSIQVREDFERSLGGKLISWIRKVQVKKSFNGSLRNENSSEPRFTDMISIKIKSNDRKGGN